VLPHCKFCLASALRALPCCGLAVPCLALPCLPQRWSLPREKCLNYITISDVTIVVIKFQARTRLTTTAFTPTLRLDVTTAVAAGINYLSAWTVDTSPHAGIAMCSKILPCSLRGQSSPCLQESLNTGHHSQSSVHSEILPCLRR